LIHDLVVHSLAEEEVLYPEFKNMMGSKCRDHALSEHKTLKNLLMDLDAMTISTPGFNVSGRGEGVRLCVEAWCVFVC
jgi:hemerythrin superfamily protein